MKFYFDKKVYGVWMKIFCMLIYFFLKHSIAFFPFYTELQQHTFTHPDDVNNSQTSAFQTHL